MMNLIARLRRDVTVKSRHVTVMFRNLARHVISSPSHATFFTIKPVHVMLPLASMPRPEGLPYRIQRYMHLVLNDVRSEGYHFSSILNWYSVWLLK